MTEEFLHFIWKFKIFSRPLRSVDGQGVHVINAGTHNRDAGPDFFNARVKIGSTLWAGNVEIHKNASDWYQHKHHQDPAYDNIILHVVYINDRKVKRSNGDEIPALEIRDAFDPAYYAKYIDIVTSRRWIPCENMIGRIPEILRKSTFGRMLAERLEEKSVFIFNKLLLNKYDWEQCFYESLARSFGFNVNAETFELLAKSLPVSVLAKHKNDLLQLESLLHGQAGMLSGDFQDEYPLSLKKEFRHLRNKYALNPVDEKLWKFLRLRPSNFPTIRISQLAQLMCQSEGLFSRILEAENINALVLFFKVKASGYWNTHYRFDKASGEIPREKTLGRRSVHLILVNTIIPFLFIYGHHKSEQKYCDRALRFLEELPGENNSLISNWEKIGIKAGSAFDSQALLQLKARYCDNKKCLECSFGNYLLKER